MSSASTEVFEAFDSVGREILLNRIYVPVYPELSDFSELPRTWLFLGVEEEEVHHWRELSQAQQTRVMQKINEELVRSGSRIVSLKNMVSALIGQALMEETPLSSPGSSATAVEDPLYEERQEQVSKAARKRRDNSEEREESEYSDTTNSSEGEMTTRTILEVMNVRLDKKTREVMLQVRHKEGTDWIKAASVLQPHPVDWLRDILPRIS